MKGVENHVCHRQKAVSGIGEIRQASNDSVTRQEKLESGRVTNRDDSHGPLWNFTEQPERKYSYK
jgi:hypothetical protein